MNRFFLAPALGAAALALATQAGAAQFGGPAPAARASYADDARQPYYESRRGAYDNGYREGVKQGEKDGRGRRPADYRDDRTWQRADKGYNRSYGDVRRYQQQFRVGFADGYRAGYSRYGQGYGNTGPSSRGRAVPRQDPYGYPGGSPYPGNRYPDSRYPDDRYGYPGQGRYPDPYYGNQGPYGNGRSGYGYDAAYPNGVNDGLVKGREDAEKRRSYDPLRHSWYRSGDRNYRREYGSKQQYQNVYREGFKEGYDRGYRERGYIR